MAQFAIHRYRSETVSFGVRGLLGAVLIVKVCQQQEERTCHISPEHTVGEA